jgi:hypothetical protein
MPQQRFTQAVPQQQRQAGGRLGQAANPQLGDVSQNLSRQGLPRVPTRPPQQLSPGQRPGSASAQAMRAHGFSVAPPQPSPFGVRGVPQPGPRALPQPGPIGAPRPPVTGAPGVGGKAGGGAPPPGLGGGLRPQPFNPALNQRIVQTDNLGPRQFGAPLQGLGAPGPPPTQVPGGQPGQRPPGQPVGK